MSDPACAPILLRVAGLPASAVEELGSELPAAVDAIAGLEGELAGLREEWVARLFAVIGDAAPEERGFLLRVKRDAFNGRPLGGHRRHALWPRVAAAVGGAAPRALAVEAELAACRERLVHDYAAVVARHRRHLAGWLRHPGFRAGMAIASPVVARNGERLLHCPPDAYGRRERRLEPTLARYVSRAACKLSPFASFTTVALAELRDGGPAVDLSAAAWRERSLVRVKRYLLDQHFAMLEAYPPFRDRLRVSLNESAIELADGRAAYLRPSYWSLDETGAKLIWHRNSLVKVRLGGPLVEALRELLADGDTTHGELLAALGERWPGEEARAQVARLVEVGVLLLEAPWPSDEGYLEKRMLAELERLPQSAELERYRQRLAELVSLQEGFAAADDPLGSRAAIDRTIEEAWRAAAPLGGLPADVERGVPTVYSIYQDVLREPAAEPGAPLAGVDAAAARSALADVEPLVAWSSFFDPRHDFLLALADFAAERWGASPQVGLVELFEVARPLWQDFVRFQVAARRSGEWPRTWNPRRLPDLERLAGRRREADARCGEWIADEDGEGVLDGGRMADFLAELPRRFRELPALGCLFLQPASADGSRWVLNRLKEGTGRFASRYTPVLEAGARQRYCAALAARGRFELEGERAELLDVLCPQGDTLNVHAPQTPAVLALPGARAGVPAERQRRLDELWVDFAPHRLPAVRDAAGRRFLPVQLGVGYYDYLPTLVKFLCTFGPNELSAVLPSPRYADDGEGGLVRGRTRVGRVVVHRRAWTCATPALRGTLDGAGDAAAFEAITRWRRRRGIPRRVFMIERVPHPVSTERVQPQYLDFSSPVFAGLFRAAVAGEERRLTLVEMLPLPEHFPRDAAGERWAVELLLDSLALRAPLPAAEPAGDGEPRFIRLADVAAGREAGPRPEVSPTTSPSGSP